jgi:hypothetical protein
VADEVLALVWNVLRKLGQEVERGEDLEVAAWAAAKIGTDRSEETAAVSVFNPV